MGNSSPQIEHYRKTYQLHLARLAEQLGDKDKAVEAAVGGDFEVFGQIEFDLLVSLGLRPEHAVIDVGCGCAGSPSRCGSTRGRNTRGSTLSRSRSPMPRKGPAGPTGIS
ncbi:MAG TPA: hypothetical protein VII43_07140 [Opitutaceae bacterium]